MTDLAQAILAGNRRAIARVLTQLENTPDDAQATLAALFPHTGKAHIIGITGSPGSGKSTLVSALAKHIRAGGQTVAILAVDPTSPYTGGAILGDRVRMGALSGDSGVFIRSMAARGTLGGLARAAREAVRVLDAAGFGMILIETVGAGQSEVEIASTAHTVIVVEAPGMGDGVQAIKAGILEIADLLVVNKADHPHAIQTVRALEMMLELGHPTRPQTVNHHGQAMTIAPSVSETPLWIPPVLQTIATDGTGIEALHTHIRAHYTHLVDQGELQARVQSALQHEFTDWLREAVFEQFLRELPTTEYASLVQDIQSQQISPRQAAQLAVQLWRNSL